MEERTSKINTGNAISEGTDKRGWFVGAFIESQGLQTNSNVEVKWGIHPKGEIRHTKAPEGDATTLALLIRGKYGFRFENREEVVLSQEGDYIMFSPNMPHELEAYEDSAIVTIRWPSLSSEKN